MKKVIALFIIIFISFPPIESFAVNVSNGSSILMTGSAEYGTNFVIKEEETLWSWGFNKWGQVGDGTTEDSTKV